MPSVPAETGLMDREIVIQPRHPWFSLDFRELWEYRDLLILLIHRDFAVKFKQTILGPAWFILQPLLMTLVFTVVFGNIARIPTDGLPPILFYLSGLLTWNYFAQTVNATSATFTANAHLFGKVYFPRLIVPLSVAASGVFAFLLQLALFTAFWIYFRFFTLAGDRFGVGAGLWSLPLLLVVVAALALGIGLWMSALTARYRDLSHLVPFLLQLGMYATPIIYPFSTVPPSWAWVLSFNPMTPLTEAFKMALLGQGLVTIGGLGYAASVAIAVLVTGMWAFHYVERHFIDTV
jgi:lipopolysaccharide transport system permease protein